MTLDEEMDLKAEKLEEMANDVKREELLRSDFQFAIDETGIVEFVNNAVNELVGYGWSIEVTDILDLHRVELTGEQKDD